VLALALLIILALALHEAEGGKVVRWQGSQSAM
jgi:hypothetical protein